MTKAEKLKSLKEGKKVKPPFKWWTKMYRHISQMKKYKGFSRKRKSAITASIWHNFSIPTQRRLVKKYA